jgi:hypothetical protein
MVTLTETREGRLLLTVVTEANGGSKIVHMKEAFLGWFVELVLPVQEIFVLLGRSTQNSLYTFSIHLTPLPSKLGRVVLQGRLSLNMCLWYKQILGMIQCKFGLISGAYNLNKGN